jgi:hypothetical protein
VKKIIILFKQLFHIYKEMALQIVRAGKFLAKGFEAEVVATLQQ